MAGTCKGVGPPCHRGVASGNGHLRRLRPPHRRAGGGGAASWLRTYRTGGPGTDPLSRLGAQDITADVAWDQLEVGTGLPVRSTQREWLVRHGIDDLRRLAVEDWHAQGAVTDLSALRARSLVNEADALCDPNGLGGFIVLEWRSANTAK